MSAQNGAQAIDARAAVPLWRRKTNAARAKAGGMRGKRGPWALKKTAPRAGMRVIRPIRHPKARHHPGVPHGRN